MISLLFKEGFILQHSNNTHCGPLDEATGMISEVITSGYYTDNRGHCENLLFARPKL